MAYSLTLSDRHLTLGDSITFTAGATGDDANRNYNIDVSVSGPDSTSLNVAGGGNARYTPPTAGSYSVGSTVNADGASQPLATQYFAVAPPAPPPTPTPTPSPTGDDPTGNSAKK